MKKLPFLAILLLLTIVVQGCKDRDDDYYVLDKNGLTYDIKSIAPQYIIDEMMDLGFPINGGNTPPTIEGTYLITPLTWLSSNIEADLPTQEYSDITVTFYNQNNVTLSLDLDTTSGNGSVGEGSGGYIVGNGADFTTFFEIIVTNTNTGASANAVYAISGTVVDNGIENLYFANFMVDDHGDPYNTYIGNGKGRVFKDGDAFSEKLAGRPATTGTTTQPTALTSVASVLITL